MPCVSSSLDDPAHRTTEQLLPWYLNGTLPAGERERIEGASRAVPAPPAPHLQLQCELQVVLAGGEPERAVEHALKRAHARIDELGNRDGARARSVRGFGAAGARPGPGCAARSSPSRARRGAGGRADRRASRTAALSDARRRERAARRRRGAARDRGRPPRAGRRAARACSRRSAHTSSSRSRGAYIVEVAPEREAEALLKPRASALVRSADRAAGAPDGAR